MCPNTTNHQNPSIHTPHTATHLAQLLQQFEFATDGANAFGKRGLEQDAKDALGKVGDERQLIQEPKEIKPRTGEKM